MKGKLIIAITCMVISMTGCNSAKYNESIEKGNEYLASKEYTKAEESFRLALTEQNDKEVFKLTEQIGSIIDIEDCIKNKEYDKALDICNQVEKKGYANDVIKKDITKFKKDIEEAIKNNKVSEEKEDKEVSNDTKDNKSTNDIDDNKEKDNNSSNDKKDNNLNSSDVEMAKAIVYNCLVPDYDETDIKLVYIPASELGDITPNAVKNNYYVFGIEDLSDGTTWDFYYIVDKQYGTVDEMDMNGNISDLSY